MSGTLDNDLYRFDWLINDAIIGASAAIVRAATEEDRQAAKKRLKTYQAIEKRWRAEHDE